MVFWTQIIDGRQSSGNSMFHLNIYKSWILFN